MEQTDDADASSFPTRSRWSLVERQVLAIYEKMRADTRLRFFF